MFATLESAPPPSKMIRLLSAPEGSQDWAVGMRYEIQVSAAQPEPDHLYIGQCIRALIRCGGWRHLRNSKKKPFRSFVQFFEAPCPHGLGMSRDEIEIFLEPAPQPAAGEREAGAFPGDRPPNGFSNGLKLVQRECLRLSQEEREDLLRWLQQLENG
jgi:hypothetical protein